MVICDLGGCDMEFHMGKIDCHIANGLNVCVVGSEGRHIYGWNKRKLNFSYTNSTGDRDWKAINSQLRRDCKGLMSLVCRDLLRSVMHQDWNMKPPEGQRSSKITIKRLIQTTFPKIRTCLLEYMFDSEEESGNDGENVPRPNLIGVDSSNHEWLADFIDIIESADDDFNVDIVEEP
jgi:hypothetical protein